MKAFLKNRSPLFWVLLFGFGLMFILIVTAPTPKGELNPNLLPWNAKVLPNHQIQALGLKIPESTLEDAMKRYGKDVEIQLFSNKDESEKSLEAYFPVIYIGSIKAALLLKLKADDATLNDFYNHSPATTVTPTGQRKVTLASQDLGRSLKLPIAAITLIPKKNLTYRAIKMRFGEPAQILKEETTQIERWRYPLYGLEIIYDPDGPDALQYAPQFASGTP